MNDSVKLIIEIPESDYKAICANKEDSIIAHDTCRRIADNGTPLDNDSDRAEAQAYFFGQAYGWEEGRKDLCDKISAEIDEKISHYEHFSSSNTANGLMIAKDIIEKHKGDKE